MLRSGAALDRGMVYWHIRLAPNLEVRIADVTPRAEQAALLGVGVRGLVEAALIAIGGHQEPPVLPAEVLRTCLRRPGRPVPQPGDRAAHHPAHPAGPVGRASAPGPGLARPRHPHERSRRVGPLRQRRSPQRTEFGRRHRLQDVVDLLAGDLLR